MKNRYFPEKPVDLLEQSFAHAVAKDKQSIGLEEGQIVAQRMVRIPLALGKRLINLEEKLKRQSLLCDEEISRLISRLQVTMRGLDLHSARPNAVIYITGEAISQSDSFTRIIAEELFWF